VLKQGQVLLGLRNSDPTKADSELKGEGSWTMPGGKIHHGESFEAAASRELTEETDLVGERFVVICVSSEHNLVIGVHFVTVGLLSEDFTGEPKALEPEEITEWRWFPLNDLPENLFPPSRKIVNNYLAGTFYTLE
ncbi:MAG: NUDIX domain-containing protein, partial [Candidatus Veblenbacteria bacterium]|nr:NUDIX domain-containing protein [Candidatus Veblenbacteria bacterium]